MCKEINREKEKFFHSITATHFPSAANKFKHKHAVEAFIYFSLIYLKKKLGIITKVLEVESLSPWERKWERAELYSTLNIYCSELTPQCIFNIYVQTSKQ